MIKEKNQVPSFIGIGAMRCGTTWIAEQLRSHPYIHVPAHYKELHYFDRYYDKGMAWYLANFSGKAEHQITGEFTPYYVRDKQSMIRIARDCPQARLILAIRNPVDRAFSHYTFLKNREHISGSFYESLFDERFDILKAGLYGKQLQVCLELFPREQLHIINFEQIRSAPDQVITELYTFLGVDASYKPDQVLKKENAKHGIKSMWLAHLLRKVKQLARPFTTLRRGLIHLGFYKFGKILNQMNATKVDQEVLDPQAVKYLKEYYQQDQLILKSMLAKEAPNWDMKI